MRVLYSFIKRMILSIHYYLFSMAFLSFNVKKRYADRLEFDNYVSTKLKKQVENKKKLPSVAAIYRVKNGAE
ncbi:TPA: hypothetical protein ACIUG1_004546, partial [Salmonella enterica subsp. enterica serovar Rough:-:-]